MTRQRTIGTVVVERIGGIKRLDLGGRDGKGWGGAGVVVVHGPNGSGKSSLVRALALGLTGAVTKQTRAWIDPGGGSPVGGDSAAGVHVDDHFVSLADAMKGVALQPADGDPPLPGAVALRLTCLADEAPVPYDQDERTISLAPALRTLPARGEALRGRAIPEIRAAIDYWTQALEEEVPMAGTLPDRGRRVRDLASGLGAVVRSALGECAERPELVRVQRQLARLAEGGDPAKGMVGALRDALRDLRQDVVASPSGEGYDDESLTTLDAEIDAVREGNPAPEAGLAWLSGHRPGEDATVTGVDLAGLLDALARGALVWQDPSGLPAVLRELSAPIVDAFRRLSHDDIEALRGVVRRLDDQARSHSRRIESLLLRRRALLSRVADAKLAVALDEALRAIQGWSDEHGTEFENASDALREARWCDDRAAEREVERSRVRAARALVERIDEELAPTRTSASSTAPTCCRRWATRPCSTLRGSWRASPTRPTRPPGRAWHLADGSAPAPGSGPAPGRSNSRCSPCPCPGSEQRLRPPSRS